MRNSKMTVRLLSVVMSLLMVLSVISFPTLKAKAAGGVDGFVERCYTVTLDRGSDPAGFAAWKDMLLNGKSVGVYIAYGFMFSDEYVAKNKDNRAFVKDLYTLFLDREPDEDGYNLWVGLLESGKSREEIFAGFANSTEFYGICQNYGITAGYYDARYDIFQINDVNLFVERMYQTCLGRRGDMDGHILWVSKLLSKELTGVECAKNFIKSDEYVSKNLSNDEYVENLYKAFMGRASDAEGKSLWLNALNTGAMTRDEVFAGFANSKEFGDICARYNIIKGSYTATDIATNNNNQNQNPGNNTDNNNNNTDRDNNNQNNQNNESTDTGEKNVGYHKTKMTLKSRSFSEPYDPESEDDYWTYCMVEEYTYGKMSNEFPLTTKLTDIKANEVISIIQTEFDINGYPSKETRIYYPDGKAHSHINTMKYNDNGVRIEYIEYNDDGSYDRIERFDDQGLLKEKIMYSYDGSIAYRLEYAKDSNGVLVGTQYDKFDGKEIIFVGETYEYDASGKLIKERDYYENGRYKNGSDYTYNSHGDLIKYESRYQTEREENGWSSLTVYEYEHVYDEHGNITSTLRYKVEDGKKFLIEEYTYEYEEYTY